MRTRPDPGNESGSAAVEFALVLPLVLMFALALVQVGLLARDRLLVEAAARAGARAAAVQDDPSAIRDASVDASGGLDPARMTVGVTRSGTRGDPVTVSVAYEEPIRVPLVAWLFGSSLRLESAATDRQEFG
jgi:TadE-like protein